MDNGLIEHLLTLLDIPENIENSHEKEPDCLLDSQHIKIAQEIMNFMDKMPGGFLIYHADEDEQIIYVNKALLEIFGCESLSEFQELTGNSFKGIVHPDDLDEVELSIREQIFVSQYDLDYVEYRIIRKDGTIRWLEDYGHYVQSKSAGNIFYVFLSDATEKINRQASKIAALISEKKEKEEKIKTIMEDFEKERKKINQEHLRRFEVIEGLSVNYESILLVDLDLNQVIPYRLSSRTKLQFDDKFQEREFQWYSSDYINTWVYSEDREFLAKETSPDYIREKLSDSKTYYVNYRICQNGETKYLQLRIVNVGDKNHISQIVMGYKNIDEEILREIEQKKTLEEALGNAKLSNVAKNTFLANMSHDMRTPLNAIFGYTNLAKTNINNTEAVKSYLDKINVSSRQLLELIGNVLEISKMESQDMSITESECNLCDIVHDVYNSFFPQASEKGVNFTLNYSSLKHYEIYADKDKIKQFLAHLTNNAIKYTNPDGMVEISIIEQEALSQDYSVFKFIIKDTGIGISSDFLENVFNPFEREKNTTLSGVYGTGLGLTITKNIVEMMGGNIKAESIPGKGSTFTATFSFRIQNYSDSAFDNIDNIINNMPNKKILLVDDNEINLEIETEILKELGFDIETAENGSIALEKVKNSSADYYALVLMDIQMPVMDGHESTRAIRKLDDPELANIPIIALSANAFESDKQMSLKSGMNAHLTKPIDIPVLLKTIAKAIRYKK